MVVFIFIFIDHSVSKWRPQSYTTFAASDLGLHCLLCPTKMMLGLYGLNANTETILNFSLCV